MYFSALCLVEDVFACVWGVLTMWSLAFGLSWRLGGSLHLVFTPDTCRPDVFRGWWLKWMCLALVVHLFARKGETLLLSFGLKLLQDSSPTGGMLR